MLMIRSVCILGSGNVATHLASAFYEAGLKIDCVYSKTLKHARELALKYNALYTCELKDACVHSTDLIVVSVKDDAIKDLVLELDNTETLIVHTAGSISIEELSKFKNNGVFYPLQTFSKSKTILLQEVPFLLEANSCENMVLLEELARKITKKVFKIDSESRLKVHLAAVFACNYTNYMWLAAHEILQETNLDFSVFSALLHETLEKAIAMKPYSAQTGPAKRGDLNVIHKHLAVLSNNPELQNLYSLISSSIFDYFNKEKGKNGEF